MAQKILIIGDHVEAKNALMIQSMKEKYGKDIILYTLEEAKEQGLTEKDFANIPNYKYTAPPIIRHVVFENYKSGKELRRERRKKERK